MARISKTVRSFCYPLVSMGLTLLVYKVLQPFIGAWAVLLCLPLLFWLHLFSPVDTLDLWLRRVTRDPYWLMTNEGAAWLRTEEGKAWLKTKKGHNWLSSTEAAYPVETHGGDAG